MSLHNIDITIRGMGGIINFEALVIERMFKELGYDVVVNNPHPYIEHNSHPSAINESEDEFYERVKALNHANTKITIKVDHCPWGG